MPVRAEQLRRAGGVAGILFVVLAVVALFLPGSPPKADEVAKITPYLTDKRGSILASSYVLGVAFTFFLIFAGALRNHFGAADPTGLRVGPPVVAGGAAAAALVLAGAAVLNGAAFRVSANPDVNQALYWVGNDIFAMAGFALAAFFLAAGLATRVTGALPALFSPAALVVAILNLVAGVALFAKSGFFSIGGAFGFIAPVLSLLWVVGASVVMLRGAPAPGSPAPAR